MPQRPTIQYPVVIDGRTYYVPTPQGMKPSPEYIRVLTERVRKEREAERQRLLKVAKQEGIKYTDHKDAVVPPTQQYEPVLYGSPEDPMKIRRAYTPTPKSPEKVRADIEKARQERRDTKWEQTTAKAAKSRKLVTDKDIGGVPEEQYLLNLLRRHNQKNPAYQKNKDDFEKLVLSAFKSTRALPTLTAKEQIAQAYTTPQADESALVSAESADYRDFSKRIRASRAYAERAQQIAEHYGVKAALYRKLHESGVLPQEALGRAAYLYRKAKLYHSAAEKAAELSGDLELLRSLKSRTIGTYSDTVGNASFKGVHTALAVLNGLTPEEAHYFIRKDKLLDERIRQLHRDYFQPLNPYSTLTDAQVEAAKTAIDLSDIGVTNYVTQKMLGGLGLAGRALGALRGAKAAGQAASLLQAVGKGSKVSKAMKAAAFQGTIGYANLVPRAVEIASEDAARAQAQGESQIAAATESLKRSLNPFSVLHDPEATASEKIVGTAMGAMMLYGGASHATRTPYKTLRERVARAMPETRDMKLDRSILEGLDHIIKNKDKIAAKSGVSVEQLMSNLRESIRKDAAGELSAHLSVSPAERARLQKTEAGREVLSRLSKGKFRAEGDPLHFLLQLAIGRARFNPIAAKRPLAVRRSIPALRFVPSEREEGRLVPAEPEQSQMLQAARSEAEVEHLRRVHEESIQTRQELLEKAKAHRELGDEAQAAKAELEAKAMEVRAKASYLALNPEMHILPDNMIHGMLFGEEARRVADAAPVETARTAQDVQPDLPTDIPRDAVASLEPAPMDDAAPAPRPPLAEEAVEPAGGAREPATASQQRGGSPTTLEERYTYRPRTQHTQTRPGPTPEAAKWLEQGVVPGDWYVVHVPGADPENYSLSLGSGSFIVGRKEVPKDRRGSVWYFRAEDPETVATKRDVESALATAFKKEPVGNSALRPLYDAAKEAAGEGANASKIAKAAADLLDKDLASPTPRFLADATLRAKLGDIVGKRLYKHSSGEAITILGSLKGAPVATRLAKFPEGATPYRSDEKKNIGLGASLNMPGGKVYRADEVTPHPHERAESFNPVKDAHPSRLYTTDGKTWSTAKQIKVGEFKPELEGEPVPYQNWDNLGDTTLNDAYKKFHEARGLNESQIEQRAFVQRLRQTDTVLHSKEVHLMLAEGVDIEEIAARIRRKGGVLVEVYTTDGERTVLIPLFSEVPETAGQSQGWMGESRTNVPAVWTTDLGPKFFPMPWAKISPGATGGEAGRTNIRILDLVQAVFGLPENEQQYAIILGHLTGTRTPLVAPGFILRALQNNAKGFIDILRSVSDGERGQAEHGLELAAKFGKAFRSGHATAEDLARLLCWSFLSRMQSPFPHESMAILMTTKGFDKWLHKAVSGDWTAEDRIAYLKWATDTVREARAQGRGVPQPPFQATSNLRDLGETLLPWLSIRDADGKTNGQKLYEAVRDGLPSKELRRMFLSLDDVDSKDPYRHTFSLEQQRRYNDLLYKLKVEEAVANGEDPKKVKRNEVEGEADDLSPKGVSQGIQNKILSFTLLVAGNTDQLIFDRVMVNNFFGPVDAQGNRIEGAHSPYNGLTVYPVYRKLKGGGLSPEPIAYVDISSIKTDRAKDILKQRGVDEPTAAEINAVRYEIALKDTLQQMGLAADDIVSPQPSSINLASNFDGVIGLYHYETMEALLSRAMEDAFRKAGIEAPAELARIHWYLWNHFGGQEASHGSLDYIMNRIQGKESPDVGVYAREGQYDKAQYGRIYAIDGQGEPVHVIMLPSPAGETPRYYVADAKAAQAFYDGLGALIKRKNLRDPEYENWTLSDNKEPIPYYLLEVGEGENRRPLFKPEFFEEVEKLAREFTESNEHNFEEYTRERFVSPTGEDRTPGIVRRSYPDGNHTPVDAETAKTLHQGGPASFLAAPGKATQIIRVFEMHRRVGGLETFADGGRTIVDRVYDPQNTALLSPDGLGAAVVGPSGMILWIGSVDGTLHTGTLRAALSPETGNAKSIIVSSGEHVDTLRKHGFKVVAELLDDGWGADEKYPTFTIEVKKGTNVQEAVEKLKKSGKWKIAGYRVVEHEGRQHLVLQSIGRMTSSHRTELLQALGLDQSASLYGFVGQERIELHKSRTNNGPIVSRNVPETTVLFRLDGTRFGEKTFAEQHSGEHAIINIGLKVGSGEGASMLTLDEAIQALRDMGVEVATYCVRDSYSEPTLIALLDRNLTPKEIESLSARLRQDAIAMLGIGQRSLEGPKAAEWGPFASEYFLVPDGRFHAEAQPKHVMVFDPYGLHDPLSVKAPMEYINDDRAMYWVGEAGQTSTKSGDNLYSHVWQAMDVARENGGVVRKVYRTDLEASKLADEGGGKYEYKGEAPISSEPIEQAPAFRRAELEKHLEELLTQVDDYEAKHPNEAAAARTFDAEGTSDRRHATGSPIPPSQQFGIPSGKKPLDGHAHLGSVRPVAEFVGPAFRAWALGTPEATWSVAEYISAFHNEYGREPDTLIECHLIANAALQEWPPYYMTQMAAAIDSLPDPVYRVLEAVTAKDNFLPIAFIDLPPKDRSSVAYCLINGPIVFHPTSFQASIGAPQALAHELWHFLVDRAFSESMDPKKLADLDNLTPDEAYTELLKRLHPDFQRVIIGTQTLMEKTAQAWLQFLEQKAPVEYERLVALAETASDSIKGGASVRQVMNFVVEQCLRDPNWSLLVPYGQSQVFKGLVAAEAAKLLMGEKRLPTLWSFFEEPAYVLTDHLDAMNTFFSAVEGASAEIGATKHMDPKYYEQTPFGPLPLDKAGARGVLHRVQENAADIPLQTVIAQAFDGAKVEYHDDGNATVHLNGAKIEIRVTDGPILPDPDILLRTHGISDLGDVVIPASWKLVSEDGTALNAYGLITLAKGFGSQDLLHESFHAAKSLGLLTDKEWKSLMKQYGDEESAAFAYERWTPAESHNVFTKLYRRALALLKGLASYRKEVLYQTNSEIFRKIRTGEVWKRESNLRRSVEVRYAARKKPPVYDENNPDHTAAILWFDSGRFQSDLYKDKTVGRTIQKMWNTEKEAFREFFKQETGRDLPDDELFAAYLAGRMGWIADLGRFAYGKVVEYEKTGWRDDAQFNRIVTLKLLDLYEEASKGNIDPNVYDPLAQRQALLAGLMARARQWELFGKDFLGYIHEGEVSSFAGTDEVQAVWPGQMSERTTGQDKGAPVKKDATLLHQASTLLYQHGDSASTMMSESVRGRIEDIADEVIASGAGKTASMQDFDPTRSARPMTDAETVAAMMAIERLRYLKFGVDSQIVFLQAGWEDVKAALREKKITRAEYMRHRRALLKQLAALESRAKALDARADALVEATRLSGTELGRALRARRVEIAHTPWYDVKLVRELLGKKLRAKGKNISVNTDAEVAGHAARINATRTQAAVKNTRNATKHPKVQQVLQKFDVFQEFHTALNKIEAEVARLQREIEGVYAKANGKAFTPADLEKLNQINAQLEQVTRWHEKLAEQMLLGADWGPEWVDIFMGSFRQLPQPKAQGQVVERTAPGGETEGHRRRAEPKEKAEKEPKHGIGDDEVIAIRNKILAKKAEMEGTKELADVLSKLSQVYRTPEQRQKEAERRAQRKAKADDSGPLHIRILKELLGRAETRERLLMRLEALKRQLDPENPDSVLTLTAEQIKERAGEDAERKAIHSHLYEEIRLTQSVIKMLEELTVLNREIETGQFDHRVADQVDERIRVVRERVKREYGYDLLSEALDHAKLVHGLKRRIAELQKAFEADGEYMEIANALGYRASKTKAVGKTPEEIAEIRMLQDRARDLERQGEYLLDQLVPTDGLTAVRIVNRAMIFTSFPARILDFVANQLRLTVENNVLSRAMDSIMERFLFPDVLRERGGSTLLKPLADGGLLEHFRKLAKADMRAVLDNLREMMAYFREMGWNRAIKGKVGEMLELPTGANADKFGLGGHPLNLRERSDSPLIRPWLIRAEGLVNALTATAGLGDVAATAMAYNRAHMSLVDSLVNHAIKEGKLNTPEEIEAARTKLSNPETPEGYQVHLLAMGDAMEQVFLGRPGQIETWLLGIVEGPSVKHHLGREAGKEVITPTARKLMRIGMDVFITEFPRIFMRLVGYNTDFAVGFAKLIPAWFAEAQKKAQAGEGAVKGVDYWDELATKRAAQLIRRQMIGVGMVALAKLYADLEEEGKVPPLATYNNETRSYTFVNVAAPVFKSLGGSKEAADVWVPLPLDQLGGPFSLFAFAYGMFKTDKRQDLKEATRWNSNARLAFNYFTASPLLSGMDRWLSIAMGQGTGEDFGYIRSRVGRAIGTTIVPGIVRQFEYAHDKSIGAGQRYATSVTEGILSQTVWGRSLPISKAGLVFKNLPKDVQAEFVKAQYAPAPPPTPGNPKEAIQWAKATMSFEADGEPASVLTPVALSPEQQERWARLMTERGHEYIIPVARSDAFRKAPPKLPERIRDKAGRPIRSKAEMLEDAVRKARTTAMACALYGLPDETYTKLAKSGVSLTVPTMGDRDDPAAHAKALQVVGRAFRHLLDKMPERIVPTKREILRVLATAQSRLDERAAQLPPDQRARLVEFKVATLDRAVPGGVVEDAVSKALNKRMASLVRELTKMLASANPHSRLDATPEGRKVQAEVVRRIQDVVDSEMIGGEYVRREIVPAVQKALPRR